MFRMFNEASICFFLSMRSFAREDDRGDCGESSFLHQIHLFIALDGFLDLFFFRKHFIEKMIHICFSSENDSNAMIVELVDHLHKSRQLILLCHIELRDISNDYGVECGCDRFIIIRSTILVITHSIHLHFLADLLVIHTANSVLRCWQVNRSRWRQR